MKGCINVMDSLIKLFSEFNFITILTIAILLCSSIIGLITFSKKVIELLEEYRKKKNEIENKDIDFKNKIDELHQQLIDDENRIIELENEICRIKNEISTIQNDLYKFNKTTSKNAVYNLIDELITKGWMSQNEYESLKELVDIYIKSGDTNYTIPGIVQRAFNLPVLTDKEIKQKNNTEK